MRAVETRSILFSLWVLSSTGSASVVQEVEHQLECVVLPKGEFPLVVDAGPTQWILMLLLLLLSMSLSLSVVKDSLSSL